MRKFLQLYLMFLSFLKLFAQAKADNLGRQAVSLDGPFFANPEGWPRFSGVSIESCFTIEAFCQGALTTLWL